MYQDKKILAVITARGGSKGIPGKNIKLLGGHPLIAWTVKAASGSKYLDDFLVSTDDEKIAEVSRQYGAPVPFMRPPELATDKAKSIPVICHALSWMKENRGKDYDYVIILQPTSPFRKSEDIDNCIKKAVETGADSVMAMYKLVNFSLKKIKKLDGDKNLPYIEGFDEIKESSARDILDSAYKRNSSVYLTRVALMLEGDLFGADSRAHIMPTETAVDIDEPSDFELAEFIAEKRFKYENIN